VHFLQENNISDFGPDLLNISLVN